MRIAFVDTPLEPIAEQMVAEFENASDRWRQGLKIGKPVDPDPR